jgi:DNA-binding IclR family transcriptional regulator
MACVNSDGTLTTSAKQLLTLIQSEGMTPEHIAGSLNLPLFKVRSSLRDMKSMGFVNQTDETYIMDERARKLLERS